MFRVMDYPLFPYFLYKKVHCKGDNLIKDKHRFVYARHVITSGKPF